MMGKLKPCPFCGAGPLLNYDGTAHRVKCLTPSCYLRPEVCVWEKENAIAAWNQRVDPVKQQLAEALKLAYKEMCEMGDIMNGMDIVFPEDVKRATPAFDSARAALAAYDEESKTS